MVKLVGRLVGLAVVLVAVLANVLFWNSGDDQGSSTEDTTISDYTADFEVGADGDLRVVETLTVDFPLSGKRGIFQFFDRVDPTAPETRRRPQDVSVTGTVVGCDTSNCGACPDAARRASGELLLLSRRAGRRRAGHHRRGPLQERRAAPLQQAFLVHGVQCGFCTPGMIMPSIDLLDENPSPSEEEIRPGSRATSAAAPATTTSSAPCSTPRALDPLGSVMTALPTHRRPPATPRDRP